MKDYKLGDYIKQVNNRNDDLSCNNLQGLSMNKSFRTTTSNIVGTDLSKYKIVGYRQFAVDFMSAIRVHKMPIALNTSNREILVSPAYAVFEVINTSKLLPEYLMMWFSRSEFDRYADFRSDAAIRGGYDWSELCNTAFSPPDITIQEKLVKNYQVISNRIALKQRINDNLVQILQNIYQDMFKNKEYNFYPLVELCSKIGSGATPKGGKESYHKYGTSLIRSTNVFDFRFSYNDLAHIDENQANELKNVTVIENDVLFNITGVSIARCCIVPRNVLPARVNQHVMILRPIAGKFMSYYLMFTLCYTDNKSVLLGIGQSGSTREAINKQEIEMFQIPVPSNDEIIAFGKIAEKFYKQMESNNSEVSHLLFMQNLILSTISRR